MRTASTALVFLQPLADPLGMDGLALPLLGRSLLQRWIEALAARDIRQLLLVGPQLDRVQATLGCGKRWGINLHYLGEEYDESMHAAAAILTERGDTMLLAIDARQAGPNPIVIEASASDTCVVQAEMPGIPQHAFRHLSADCPDRWPPLLTRLIGEMERTYPATISAAAGSRPPSAAGLLLGYTRELFTSTPSYRGRGCRIHPSARIEGPVYLGSHVRIGAGAVIGPYTCIGDRSVIGESSHLHNTLVAPATCVGEVLDLEDSVVLPGLLCNARLGTHIPILDETLLGHLSPGRSIDLRRLRPAFVWR